MVISVDTFEVSRPTFLQKTRRFLFPYRSEFEDRVKFQELPNGSYKPGTTVDVGFGFSLLDRCRILFGGCLSVKVVVNCERDPGTTEAKTFIQIL